MIEVYTCTIADTHIITLHTVTRMQFQDTVRIPGADPGIGNGGFVPGAREARQKFVGEHAHFF